MQIICFCPHSAQGSHALRRSSNAQDSVAMFLEDEVTARMVSSRPQSGKSGPPVGSAANAAMALRAGV